MSYISTSNELKAAHSMNPLVLGEYDIATASTSAIIEEIQEWKRAPVDNIVFDIFAINSPDEQDILPTHIFTIQFFNLLR